MADKKLNTSNCDPLTQEVIDTLNSILAEFKRQAQSNTPPPLTKAVVQAQKEFNEITDALNFKAPSGRK